MTHLFMELNPKEVAIIKAAFKEAFEPEYAIQRGTEIESVLEVNNQAFLDELDELEFEDGVINPTVEDSVVNDLLYAITTLRILVQIGDSNAFELADLQALEERAVKLAEWFVDTVETRE